MRRPSRTLATGVGFALVALSAAAYAPALRAPLVFDDVPSIDGNPSIRHLRPISDVFRVPPRLALTGRPIANASFALSYAFNRTFAARAPGGVQSTTLGHRLLNLALHLANALLLFGVIRRTIVTQRFSSELRARAGAVAAIAAALWAIHPLQTEAVNYLVQRTELLVSFFLLGTLYCWIRAWDTTRDERRAIWRVSAVAACALGMGSKEVMIVAPLLVLLYDRAFRVESWASLFGTGREQRGRTLFYGLLWLTGVWVIAITLDSPRGNTVGFAHVAWYQYLYAQGWAIPHYVRLAFLPVGQAIDYGDTLAVGPGAILGLAALATVFGLTILAWRRPERWGWAAFLGSWFFLILAPSSSVVPIVTEFAAERRFYLPLAAVIVAAIVGVIEAARGASVVPAAVVRPARFVTRHARVVAAAVFVTLAMTTWTRSRLYQDREALFRDAMAHVPNNARAYSNLAALIEKDANRLEEAAELYRRSLAVKADYPFAQQRLASIYVRQRRLPEARALISQLLSHPPDDPAILGRLGLLIGALGDPAAAVPLLERAASTSTDASWYSELGTMYAGAGRLTDAVAALERALALEPERTTTRSALGFVLIALGRARDAVPHLERAAREDPQSGVTFARLALAQATIGDRAAAARAASQAGQLAGSDARVLTMAGRAFRIAGFPVEAEAVYGRALQINPNDAESQRALTELRGHRVP